MKQRFLIESDENRKELVIREYAEVEKDDYALLCTETFELSVLEEAMKHGEEGLLQALRTRNFYPPAAIAGRLSEKVTEVIQSKDLLRTELMFDDKEIFQKIVVVDDLLEEIDEDVDEKDGDDLEDLLVDDEEDIQKISSPLKVAEDEGPEEEEES